MQSSIFLNEEPLREGIRALYGIEMPKDERRAYECFLAAKETREGAFLLGVCADRGYGIPKDPRLAFQFYEMAGAGKEAFPEADFNAACALLWGEGVPEDPARGVKLLEKGIVSGHPESCFQLALCHEFGVGTEKSEETAQKLYQLAAQELPIAEKRIRKHSFRYAFTCLVFGVPLAGITVVFGMDMRSGTPPSENTAAVLFLSVLLVCLTCRMIVELWKGGKELLFRRKDARLPLRERMLPKMEFPYSCDLAFAKCRPLAVLEPSETEEGLRSEEPAAKEDAKEPVIVDMSQFPTVTPEILRHSLPSKPFTLILEGDRVTDETLEQLAGDPHLQNLFLVNCAKISENGLRHLLDCPELKVLNLLSSFSLSCTRPSYPEVSDQWLEVIGKMTRLEELHLIGCSRLTDTGIQHLRPLKELRFFALSGNRNITDQAISEFLRGLPFLRIANLGFSRLTGECFRELPQLFQFSRLMLFFAPRLKTSRFLPLKDSRTLKVIDARLSDKMFRCQARRIQRELPNCAVLASELTGRRFRRTILWSILLTPLIFFFLLGLLGLLFKI